MICQSCRDRHHEECRGGSWCDCQHAKDPATPGRRDEGARSGPAEPKVNWKRQG
ncbi:hypothetical protein J4573_38870 [Actinomadura barringtoniae]|uniref:Uncharacterized protein n=1 Tax=Actinomadura barringtoniae TaxID=1427535 RepID=A0A939PIL7_9ACTN|nr:hypothetical protein [Actinomadura barringtoniae]MBO2453110.1 hypothetical protein [Actinomadura barringtoniae]